LLSRTTHRLRLNDRFELKAQAGVGGMGTVYQAIDRRTGGLVGVKILNVKNLTDVGRFDQEAALLRELRHPGIVRYIDHGLTSHGDPYIAMEWLDGETLEQRLARGRLAPAGVAHLAAQVLEGLAVAHERGVVHRDIKPSNLFLVGWRLFDVRIIDFGVARRVLDPKRFTRRGSTVGTPLYTAPEQARGEGNIDGRADIFSLACVLFECLVGQPPFSGATAQDVMTQICLGPAPDLRERCRELDPDLGHLVGRMLAQDRRVRPGDGRELARQFRGLATSLGAAESSELRTDPGRPPDALGFSEQRVMCGLVAAFGARPRRRSPALGTRLPPRHATSVRPVPVLPIEEDRRATNLRSVAAELGVSVEAFAADSFILTPSVLGPIADQARLMARTAARLCAVVADARYSLGVGRAMVLAGLPVGDLVERLPGLLPDTPGNVRLDDMAARLLPPGLVARDGAGAWLHVEDHSQPTALSPADGRQPPFVGREREMDALAGTFAEVAEEGVARAALLVGTPGQGKTRLARELVTRARSSGRPAAVYLLRGRPDRANLPYSLLAPVIAEADLELHDVGAREAALVDRLGELARKQPVLIVADDLQWADGASVQVLDVALRELRDLPLFVVGLARPEIEERLPGLWRERNVECTRLAPLARRACGPLLRYHLPQVSPELEEHVFDRWQGNPLFLRELVAAWRPDARLAPDSVLGTVEARIFALEDEPRRVLRAASLLGDTFEFEGVLALLGLKGRRALEECIRALVDADLIQPLPAPAVGVFTFRERLVREAAFAMLSAADRALGVARARQWLEEAGKTLPELLAMGPSSAPLPAA
jgi:hypothetical protein